MPPAHIAAMTAIPALPDAERRTRTTVSASTGPVSVGFDVYGNSTDYANWLEVYADGVKLTAVTDWTLDSPSGSLATLARPITDARVTFTSAVTATVDIVGADRPRRATQLVEGQGVSAHAFNQFATQMIARLREAWDIIKTRALIGRPGEAVDLTLPTIASRAGNYLTFDSDGKPTATAAPVLGGGTLANNAVTNAYLRDSAATSVIGRSANSLGDPADITSSADGQFLIRLSSALAFTTITAALDAVFGSTRGMLLVRGSSSWQALALGTTGKFLKSDGTDAAWAVPTAGLPRGYIDGCKLANNVSDATNDIDFAAGVCRDSTNTVDMTVAALTKRLDADWAAGTNQGMRYSGAAITDTTYHLFVITKADLTQDFFAYAASTDPTAVLPSGYLYFRRIGSIVRSGGGIAAFIQNGDRFRLKSKAAVTATNPGTSAASYTLSTMPLGLNLRAMIWAEFRANGSGNAAAMYVSALDESDEAPSVSAVPYGFVTVSGQTNNNAASYMEIATNTAAQVRARISASASTDVIVLVSLGWIDSRGKDS